MECGPGRALLGGLATWGRLWDHHTEVAAMTTIANGPEPRRQRGTGTVTRVREGVYLTVRVDCYTELYTVAPFCVAFLGVTPLDFRFPTNQALAPSA